MTAPAIPIHLAGATLGSLRHVCAFFNTPDEEYRVLLPFILEGLENVLQENPFFVPPDELLRELREQHARRAVRLVSRAVAASVASADERQLRACVRDLVALSSMQTLWVRRPPDTMSESLRELLATMLCADAVYVQLAHPESGQPIVAVTGATRGAFDAALRGATREEATAWLPCGDRDAPLRLART